MSELVKQNNQRKLAVIKIKDDLTVEVFNTDHTISAGKVIKDKDGNTILDENGVLTVKKLLNNTILVSGDYLVQDSDTIIEVDATSTNIIISLTNSPLMGTGKIIYVKKVDTSNHTVTIDCNTSEMIDGQLTRVLSIPYEVVSISANSNASYSLLSHSIIDLKASYINTNQTGQTVQDELDSRELLANKSTNTSLGTSNTLYPTQNAVKTYVDNVVASDIGTNQTGQSVQNELDSLFSTKENVSNKSTNTSLGTSNTLYPTQNAVKTYVDNFGVPIENTVFVSKNGNDSNNGSINKPFLTIAAAQASIIDAADNKVYEIKVFPGIYTEQIPALPNIVISGTDKNLVIINYGSTLYNVLGTLPDAFVTTGSTFGFSNIKLTSTNAINVVIPSSDTDIGLVNFILNSCEISTGNVSDSLLFDGAHPSSTAILNLFAKECKFSGKDLTFGAACNPEFIDCRGVFTNTSSFNSDYTNSGVSTLAKFFNSSITVPNVYVNTDISATVGATLYLYSSYIDGILNIVWGGSNQLGATVYSTIDSLPISSNIINQSYLYYLNDHLSRTENTIFVSKNGNNTTADGSLLKPFLTLQAASTYVQTLSTSIQYVIFIFPGTYDVSAGLDLWPNITWVGINNKQVIIDYGNADPNSNPYMNLGPNAATADYGGYTLGFENVHIKANYVSLGWGSATNSPVEFFFKDCIVDVVPTVNSPSFESNATSVANIGFYNTILTGQELVLDGSSMTVYNSRLKLTSLIRTREGGANASPSVSNCYNSVLETPYINLAPDAVSNKTLNLYSALLLGCTQIDLSGNGIVNATIDSIPTGITINNSGTFTYLNDKMDHLLLHGASTAANCSLIHLDSHEKITQTTPPGITPNANAGTGASASVGNTDEAGIISITTGTGSTSGTEAAITFNIAFNLAPIVIISPKSALAAGVGAYTTAEGTGGFSIGFSVAPADGNTYDFSYRVIEGV